jgi:hypothetical protein
MLVSLLKIKPGAVIFQVKITLLGITPAIWRRLLLPGNTKLEQVHEAIQGAFGWQNCHLHEFQIGSKRYGDPDVVGELINERGTRSKLKYLDLAVGDKFFYVYDFGDDWRHEVEIEAILPPDSNGYYPTCTDGARACPPEDCGGVPGYMHLVRSPTVVGSSRPHFDADHFDLKEAEKGLHSFGLLMMTLS